MQLKSSKQRKEVKKVAVTEKLAQYARDKAVNLSAMSRATGISYNCLYASLGEKGRNRPLPVDEALLVCKFLEVNPMDFAEQGQGVAT